MRSAEFFVKLWIILGWGKSNFGFFHGFQSEFIHINFKLINDICAVFIDDLLPLF